MSESTPLAPGYLCGQKTETLSGKSKIENFRFLTHLRTTLSIHGVQNRPYAHFASIFMDFHKNLVTGEHKNLVTLNFEHRVYIDVLCVYSVLQPCGKI